MKKKLLYGVELQEFTAFEGLNSWLKGEAAQPPSHVVAFAPCWALALCNDGVTWGRLHTDTNTWVWGNAAFPDLSPPVTTANLQELRVFGKDGELLVWREDCRLKGRVLQDCPAVPPDEKFLQPIQERQILLGNVIKECQGSFIRVANRAGREQALPLAYKAATTCEPKNLARSPFRLVIKHYMARDDDNGAVKIAASRLVGLEEVG